MCASAFLIAHSHCADTVFAVARPVGTDETVTSGRSMIAPTSDRWPQRRVNSCGVRFNSTPRQQSCLLPLTVEPIRCGEKFSSARTQHEANMVFSVVPTPGCRNIMYRYSAKAPLKKRNRQVCSLQGRGKKSSSALALRETSWFSPLFRHRAARDKCIRRCVNSLLKERMGNGYTGELPSGAC